MMPAEKLLENRLRKRAARLGYRLKKWRRRNPQSLEYGGFMLMDVSTNSVVLGGSNFTGYNYSASLTDLEHFFRS